MANQIITQGYVGANLLITQGYNTSIAVLGGDSFYFYFGANTHKKHVTADLPLLNLVKKYLESIQHA